MKQYIELGHHILANGTQKTDRTGTGTLSVFGYQMRFSLQDGFPIITTKDMSDFRFKGVVEELLWFISGSGHLQPLLAQDVNIWNRDAYRQYTQAIEDPPMSYGAFVERLHNDPNFLAIYGNLGPIYGVQWRKWETSEGSFVDQLQALVDSLRNDPDSRRHILTAWNVGQLPKMALPPCHVLLQCYVADGVLSGQLYQRSADYLLGVPYNVSSYALLLHLLAHCLGYRVGEFVHTIGDAHIYLDHIQAVQTQLAREPLPLPQLELNPFQTDLFRFTGDDICLVGYQSHGEIKGKQSF